MTDYTALDNVIKATLQNDTWIGNNVQTIETLRNYQGFHNDSLEFKSPEEYSYLKEQSMDIGDMGLTDR